MIAGTSGDFEAVAKVAIVHEVNLPKLEAADENERDFSRTEIE